MGLPDDVSRRQALLDTLANDDRAYQSLRPGIGLCRLNIGEQPGLALQIAPEALQACQLERVLERRFEHARVFDGCFVYLDAKGNLVIWHALTPSSHALDDTISRMLSLARLQALDLHRTP